MKKLPLLPILNPMDQTLIHHPRMYHPLLITVCYLEQSYYIDITFHIESRILVNICFIILDFCSSASL